MISDLRAESLLRPTSVAESRTDAADNPAVRPSIVYLVRREGLTAVFASQVSNKVAAIAEAGFDTSVAVFTPAGQWLRPKLRHSWQELVDSAPDSIRGRMFQLPSLPSRFDWPMAEARLLRWWLRSRYGRSKTPVVLQCRNATMTRMALWARRGLPDARVIFDCRGVADHEFLYVRGTDFDSAPPDLKAHAFRLRDEQRLACREADGILCVSAAMVNYLVREYAVPAEKCTVVPCCVDAQQAEAAAGRRDEMRKRLGFEGGLVIAYCGSLSNWQCPHESLALFRKIRQFRHDAHFFAITTQPDAMRQVAGEMEVSSDRMTIVSVPHDKVAANLAAADIGLLLRKRCAVNEVASPVKFAEYLASGTPVILSDGIGDYSDLMRREQVGLVMTSCVEVEEENTRLQRFLEGYSDHPAAWRQRCRQVARQRLDSSHYQPRIAELYERLVR